MSVQSAAMYIVNRHCNTVDSAEAATVFFFPENWGNALLRCPGARSRTHVVR